jgi:1,4-dihydroxy-2-naphthoyl-CoA hydrolase
MTTPGGMGLPMETLPMPAQSAFLDAAGFQMTVLEPTVVEGYVDAGPQHHTPWGIVHGGLYAMIIESAASLGASAAVAGRGQFAVGVNNQTDFLRPHVAGRLDVNARPIQQGRTLQLWLVELTNSDGKTVARGARYAWPTSPSNERRKDRAR